MMQPTLAEAYEKAVRIIGDQAVQIALLQAEIARLTSLKSADTEELPDSGNPQSHEDAA